MDGTPIAGERAVPRRAADLTTQPTTMPVAAPFEPRRRVALPPPFEPRRRAASSLPPLEPRRRAGSLPPLEPRRLAVAAPPFESRRIARSGPPAMEPRWQAIGEDAGDASEAPVLVIASSADAPIQVIAPGEPRPPEPAGAAVRSAMVTTQTRSPPPAPRPRRAAAFAAGPAPAQQPPTTTQVWSAPGPAAPVFVDPATTLWPAGPVGARSRRADELSASTLRFVRAPKRRRVTDRLWLPVLLIAIAGAVIGGFVLFAGGATARDPVPAAPPPRTATTPIIGSAISDDASAAEIPVAPTALVEVRIESKPSGATVALIDRGKSQLLGTTPIAASLDPSRAYELVFSRGGAEPDLVERLDPQVTRRVSVVLPGHRR